MSAKRGAVAASCGDGDSLDALLAAIRACRVCQTNPEGAPMPHVPRPVIQAASTARLAICGQAPGLRVHESGIPFNDRSGVRLREWLDVTSAEFYDSMKVATLPMGFCFPGYDSAGGDLPPRRECAPLWRAAVLGRLPNLELMLIIGRHAMAWHLPELKRQPMTRIVAQWHDILNRKGGGPALLPLPHPSWRNTGWLKANPWFERSLVPVLQSRVRALI